MVSLCALLSLTSVRPCAGSELYVKASVDAAGRLQIVTSDGRTITIHQREKQIGFAQIAVSPDGGSVGWLGLRENCCTSYPIPMRLVIYRAGTSRTFEGIGLPVFRSVFLEGGKFVALYQTWLNAFASEEEKDGVDAAYRRNEPLMARLLLLTKRNEEFRDALSTTLTKHRRDLSGDAVWRMAGARFVVTSVTRNERAAEGPVFESSGGERFMVAPTDSLAAGERLAARMGPGSTILAVQPQWSFPAEAWIAADPDFWSSNPVVHGKR